MAYTSKTLVWQSYIIDVRYDPDPFNLASCHQEAMGHVEIRMITPENTPLPITETGYLSHFTQRSIIDEYDSVEAFVRTWLDHEAQFEAWKMAQEEVRQLNLF